jgi:hypothetical protein
MWPERFLESKFQALTVAPGTLGKDAWNTEKVIFFHYVSNLREIYL